MTKDEVMTMALEALQIIAKIEHPEHKVSMRKTAGGHIVTIYPYKIALDAITVLREALAQPEQWTPEDTAYRPGGLSHPEQMARLGWQCVECPACGSEVARAFPKPEQEPVAEVLSSGEYDFPVLQWLSANHSLDTAIGSLLYASPPQRQPLSLEQYDAGLLNDFGGGNVDWWQDYIRAELGRAYDFYQSQAAHGIGDKT